MHDDVELEILVLRHPDDVGDSDSAPIWRLQVQLRAYWPKQHNDEATVTRLVTLNQNELNLASWQEYGENLSDALFADEELKRYYSKVAGAAGKRPLRVRLTLDPGVAALHRLRWEALAEPTAIAGCGRGWLAISGLHPFSRFLPAPAPLRPRSRDAGRPRALIVVANPPGLAGKGLVVLDVPAEIARAEQSLSRFDCDTLADDPAGGDPVTLDLIFQRLRRGYDLLYLICHGQFRRKIEGEPRSPWLLLTGADGQLEEAPGSKFVARLAGDLVEPPSLVFLASCDSAGADQPGAPSDERSDFDTALGPRLVTEGRVPAVLAMRGKVGVDTATAFAAAFFNDLSEHGNVDRAASVARAAVIEKGDCWRPVLFSGLRTGDLWPPAHPDPSAFDRWEAMQTEMVNGRCLPILGAGSNGALLAAPGLYSDRPEVLQPLDSPLAAQQILVKDSRPVLDKTYLADRAASLLARSRHAIDLGAGPEDEHAAAWALIEDRRRPLAERAWALLRLCDAPSPLEDEYGPARWNDLPSEAHGQIVEALAQAVGGRLREGHPLFALARLRKLRFYVTVNHDSLLAAALTAAGRPPVVRLFRWSDRIDVRHELVQQQLAEHERPTVDRPLVYHLLGHVRYPDSLVLTEDDYFQYLMAARDLKRIEAGNTQPLGGVFEARNSRLVDGAPHTSAGIPDDLDAALTVAQLLFLGFQMNDWALRAALRSVLNDRRVRDRGGARNSADYPLSVSVQLAPEESQMLPGLARQYLNGYLSRVTVTTFWGELESFFRILRDKKFWS